MSSSRPSDDSPTLDPGSAPSAETLEGPASSQEVTDAAGRSAPEREGPETWSPESIAPQAGDARASSAHARASATPRASTPVDATRTTAPDADHTRTPEDTGAPPPVASRPALPDRYSDRGLLGMGGMGEVRRVYDRVLDRMVAMKLVRADRSGAAHVRDHFAAEARATARLAHPGIVPVYDHGVTPDGRLWFTMQEIRGENVQDLIARLHPRTGAPEGRAELPPGFRRLVDVLERAARAVAYAHDQGVVHRDLKPANVLVGEHGEVIVVDWGLVRPAGIERGSVAGTPVYMSPEQARGSAVDPRSDVYGLGMILWELCAGHHPFPGAETTTVLGALARGEVPGPPPTPWLVPDELLSLLAVATSAEPARRPRNGAAFADALRSWLDGETRREKARARVARAREVEAAIAGLVADERRLRAEVRTLLAGNRASDPDSTRETAWAAEDEANTLARRIAVANRAVEDELEAALIHDPDAIDAHAMLTRRLRAAQADAEARGATDAAADLEVRLRRHCGALPAEHSERRRTLDWLQGDGHVTLVTDPAGARVELFRYVTERRRLVPRHVRTLGITPLDRVVLPRGSWLLEIHHEGREPVRYPVLIERETVWDGVAPDDTTPTAIALPRAGTLGPDDVYVPAGWADLGGDPDAPSSFPGRRVWVDGFVMRRFPVTNAEYIAFLDDLVARGREAEAERYAPRNRGRTPGVWGEILYGRDADGRFILVTDADGDTWDPRWPVTMIDHGAAWAFARWEAGRTGLPWRLPVEFEWEKAARGVDRRVFPWGDFADSTWCNNRTAFAGQLRLETVGARPDESPYGLRDMAGAVIEWTADRMIMEGPPGIRAKAVDGSEETEDAWAGRSATWRIVARGGSWLHDLKAARTCFRSTVEPWMRNSNAGLRLVRSYG